MLLHNAPIASFDDPIEMLYACHGKILEQCNTLNKMLVHQIQFGCDTSLQQAAGAILRYFNTSGLYHHQDEEENLFPALRAVEELSLTALMAELLEQHEFMLEQWAILKLQLERISSAETDARLDNQLVETFTLAYRNHIAIENEQLLPQAKKLLPEVLLTQLGAKMAKRRKL